MHGIRLSLLILTLSAAAAGLFAISPEDLEAKPPEQWTLEEVEAFLSDSPWARIRNLMLAPRGRVYPVQFIVRVRSARPVLLALARRMAALPDERVRSAAPPDPSALRRTADSLTVSGQLLISVHCTDSAGLDGLNRQSIRTLRDHAYIDLAGSGRRIRPIAYEAPWKQSLHSAVFHFPRPTIEEAGNRITFVARFGAPNVVKLEADFDPAKLRWEGQIEY